MTAPLAIDVRAEKRYGALVALDGATLRVRGGTIHAVVGENGAGKSTLLKVVFGLVRADRGALAVGGKSVDLARHAPSVARSLGVGMVQQHGGLVPSLSAVENAVLGREGGVVVELGEPARTMRALGDDAGLAVDPFAVVEDLPVAVRQRAEIVGALLGGAGVLILDEPTAVLAPVEVDGLLKTLRALRDDGRTVVLVTHKLDEVRSVADDITVLRRGRTVATFRGDADSGDVARAIVGGDVPRIASLAAPAADAPVVLAVRGLSVGTRALVDVDLAVRAGEIVGVAGVEGNGQRELTEALAGLVAARGSVTLGGRELNGQGDARRGGGSGRGYGSGGGRGGGDGDGVGVGIGIGNGVGNSHGRGGVVGRSVGGGRGGGGGGRGDGGGGDVRSDRAGGGRDVGVGEGDVVAGDGRGDGVGRGGRVVGGRRGDGGGRVRRGSLGVAERHALGLGHIPDDRHARGLLLGSTVGDNLVFGRADVERGFWRDFDDEDAAARRAIAAFDIRPSDPAALAGALSGGNQQKVVVARELGRPSLKVVVAAQPTRGVDLGAVAAIHDRLRGVARAGAGVLLISADIDELLVLSHRVLVLYRGRIVGEIDPRSRDARERIGRLVVGLDRASQSVPEIKRAAGDPIAASGSEPPAISSARGSESTAGVEGRRAGPESDPVAVEPAPSSVAPRAAPATGISARNQIPASDAQIATGAVAPPVIPSGVEGRRSTAGPESDPVAIEPAPSSVAPRAAPATGISARNQITASNAEPPDAQAAAGAVAPPVIPSAGRSEATAGVEPAAPPSSVASRAAAATGISARNQIAASDAEGPLSTDGPPATDTTREGPPPTDSPGSGAVDSAARPSSVASRAVAALVPTRSTYRELQISVVALLVVLALGSVLMLVFAQSPLRVWSAMASETLGEAYNVGQVIYKATALTFTGLAVALALDAGLFNIGVEGQLIAGTVGCAVAGSALPAGTPSIVAIPFAALGGAVAGAAVGALTGWMRAYRGAHEVITGIMLNIVVGGVALWLGNAVIFEGGTARGAVVVPGARLPELGLGGSAASIAALIALATAGAIWTLRARSWWGARWRAVGAAPPAAEYLGVRVKRTQVAIMAASGALAGLAAINFVLGHKHAFEEGLGRNVGFLGVAVGLLGRSHPGGVVIAAVVVAFLSQGGQVVPEMVPKELTELLLGVAVLAVAIAAPLVARLEARRR